MNEKIIIQSNEKNIKFINKLKIISIIICIICLIIIFTPFYDIKNYEVIYIIQKIMLGIFGIFFLVAGYAFIIKFKSTIKVTNTKIFGKSEGNSLFELSIDDIAQIELFSEKQIKITDINNNIYYFPGINNAEEIIKVVNDIKENKN